MIINRLYIFFYKIIRIGIYKDTPAEDRDTIVLFNRFSYMISFLLLIITIQDALIGTPLDLIVDSTSIVIISSGPVLNYFRLHSFAKAWSMLMYPTFLVAPVMIMYGDILYPSYSFFVFFTYTLLFFNNKKTLFLLPSYLVLLWVFLQYYTLHHAPFICLEPTILDRNLFPLITFTGLFFIVCNYKTKVKKKEDTLEIALKNAQKQNEKLNIANTELERFAFVTSHDLKTPVRTIVSFLNLIEIKIKKQEYADLEHYITFAKDGGLQINRLISEILEFSKLNINQTLERTEVDLDTIFNKNVTNLQGYISEKNAKVESGILGKITSNELFVGLLFQNLIENAIKFNKNEQPLVKVTAEKSENGTSISFQDNGIGIEKEFQESVFHIFNRLHSQQDYAGTGMGLAICKKIMERLGGTILLTSEQGVGTNFILFFPK